MVFILKNLEIVEFKVPPKRQFCYERRIRTEDFQPCCNNGTNVTSCKHNIMLYSSSLMYPGGTKSNTECALYFKPDFFSPWKTNGIVAARGQFVLYQRRMFDFLALYL